jgi:hypothetical protein
VEQGLAALKEKTHAGKVMRHGDILVLSRCFRVTRQVARNPERDPSFFPYWQRAQGGGPWPSARVFIALSGFGVFHVNGCAPVPFQRGDAVVIPAAVEDFDLSAQWEIEFLNVTIPTSADFRLVGFNEDGSGDVLFLNEPQLLEG